MYLFINYGSIIHYIINKMSSDQSKQFSLNGHIPWHAWYCVCQRFWPFKLTYFFLVGGGSISIPTSFEESNIFWLLGQWKNWLAPQITQFIQVRGQESVIITGDINFDYNKRTDPSYHLRRLYDTWLSLEEASQLVQLVDFTTWSRTCQGQLKQSTLDHVLTNNHSLNRISRGRERCYERSRPGNYNINCLQG